MISPFLEKKTTVRVTLGGYAYGICRDLLTAQEIRFYECLLPISMNLGLLPFPKVPVEEFISASLVIPSDDQEHGGTAAVFPCFDFVLCEAVAEGLRPMIAIDLTERSLFSSPRKQDKSKEELCRESGFELIRLPRSGPYDSAKIAERIRKRLW